MGVYFNEKYKDQVYLLEFKKNSDSDSEFFSFSIPPQSEDFNFPQRIGETKTFGGSVFEDYGNDTVKITLSGTTVNNKMRKLYKNGSGEETLDGEGEIFKLQKMIQSYGEQKNLNGKSVYLYSLESDNKYWQIIINELQIKRSKDNPMAYNYTISFTGFPTNSKIAFIYNKGSDFSENLLWYENVRLKIHNACMDIVDRAKGVKDTISSTAYPEIFNLFSDLIGIAEDVDAAMASVCDIYNGILDVANMYIPDIVGIGDNIKSRLRLTNGVIDNIYNSALSLVEKCSAICSLAENFTENDVLPETMESYSLTDANDFVYNLRLDSGDMMFLATDIMATLKNSVNSTKIIVKPGSDSEDDEVIVSYGFKQTIVNDSDTWDSLAYKFYGDSSLGGLIALYNGFDDSNKSLLNAGTSIKIPILSKTESTAEDNLVYTNPDELDNYGKDLELTSKGALKEHFGDFEVIDGMENLKQAINSRLQTGLNSRMKLAAYGIKSIIGSTSKASNYIIASIKQTLLEEPRIKSIESIEFKGSGDTIDTNIIYTDINNIEHEFGGTI